MLYIHEGPARVKWTINLSNTNSFPQYLAHFYVGHSRSKLGCCGWLLPWTACVLVSPWDPHWIKWYWWDFVTVYWLPGRPTCTYPRASTPNISIYIGLSASSRTAFINVCRRPEAYVDGLDLQSVPFGPHRTAGTLTRSRRASACKPRCLAINSHVSIPTSLAQQEEINPSKNKITKELYWTWAKLYWLRLDYEI